jgi:Fe-S cluster assembly ATP-binding protein|tara:strand:+ start:3373 stop:4071 length:699 start_codon:yes stop_codon:yes gene_type:complete
MLKVSNLHANIGDVKILNGIDLEIGKGELHAVMGPNGSGKSTLCHVLMGNPDFDANGEVSLNGSKILEKPQFERAEDGIFQSYQYPVGLPGVSLMEFIMASNEGLSEDEAVTTAKKFNVENFLDREVNVDLSGGEKKRSELFQLAIKKPKLALLDEIDSGLDIDAIKTVANLINENRDDETSYLLVTHYSRILRYLDVDKVHIVVKGNVVKSGNKELIEEVDSGGYTQYQEQ